MTSSYYIYLHRRDDNGDVFYVGKGTRTPTKQYGRAYEMKRRSRLWNFIFQKVGCKAEVFADFFLESDAFECERALIAEYGRRDLGRGHLVNMTDGGEGMCGHKPTPETTRKRLAKLLGRPVSMATRKMISEKLSGERHPFFGTQRAISTRKKQSLALIGKRLGGLSPSAKIVVDTANGRTFPSVRDAAIYLGANMNTLGHKLSGYRRNDTSMRFA